MIGDADPRGGVSDPDLASDHPDHQLERAARTAEFSLFYTDQTPQLVAHLLYLGVPARMAAELAQDAMTEAFRQWDNLDHPRAWVRTVAARRWFKQRSQLNAEILLDDLPAGVLILTDDVADTIVQRHTVLAELERLPPAQRQVLAWAIDGYQPIEIAAILGKPPATVRALLRQAREKLRSVRLTGETP